MQESEYDDTDEDETYAVESESESSEEETEGDNEDEDALKKHFKKLYKSTPMKCKRANSTVNNNVAREIKMSEKVMEQSNNAETESTVTLKHENKIVNREVKKVKEPGSKNETESTVTSKQ